MRRQTLPLPEAVRATEGALANAGQAASDKIVRNPQTQTFAVGDIRVTVISDGYLNIEADALIGVDETTYSSGLKAARFLGDVYTSAVSGYLIEIGEKRILVDTGTGPSFGPLLGNFNANLQVLGIDPKQIDMVLATHLHPDHIGGLLTDAGSLLSGANFVVSEADRAFWTDETIKSQSPDHLQSFFDMASGAIELFGDSVTFFSGESEVTPGITSIPLPGHTPGHTGFMLESGGERLLIWGDIVHAAPFQLPNPNVGVAFDADPDQAVATRKKTLDMVVADGLRVAGCHLPFPGVGYIEKSGDGYLFVPTHCEYF